VTSYADNSYVICTVGTMEEFIQATRATMEKHFSFLDELGMAVNRSKTKLMFMAHGRDILPEKIAVTDQNIPVSDTLKVLGVLFDKDLQWKTQASSLVTRERRMISGLKVIRSKLTRDQFMKVITSQYFGMGCQSGMTHY